MSAFSNKGLLGVSGALALIAGGLAASGSSGMAMVSAVAAGVTGCAALVAGDPRIGILTTAAANTAISAYLLSLKVDGLRPEKALCNIGASFDCEKVNTSAWSEIGGIPVTLLGLAYYVALIFVAMNKKADTRRLYQVTFFTGLASVGFSAFLGYQTWLLKTTCLFCIALYLGNALLLWAGVRGAKAQGQGVTADMGGLTSAREASSLVGAFSVLLLVGTFGWKQVKADIQPGADGGSVDVERLGTTYTSVPSSVSLDGSEPVLGDSAAPYTIVEFADFGCPHCAEAAKPLKKLVSENPAIQLRFKVFPLTGECHPGLNPGQPERCQAAAAAECARQQGKFWQMQETLFENQTYFAADDLAFMAKQVGLDASAFQTCMNDPATLQGVEADAKAGDAAGVQGTPALFLRGTHGDQWLSVRGTAETIGALVKAHQSGVALPSPQAGAAP
jgi:protein-disulfide isomerase